MANLDAEFSFRPLAPEDADLEMFQKLTQALKERRVIKFQYRNQGARKAMPRQVRPYHLACIDSHWYLFAHDVDRQAMRTFVLSRMTGVGLTRKRFPKPRNFDLDEYLKGSFTVFKGKDDYGVVVEFDRWATDLLRGRRWHSSQEFDELKDGRSRLRFSSDRSGESPLIRRLMKLRESPARLPISPWLSRRLSAARWMAMAR